MKFCWVYVTTSGREMAERISNALLSSRLVASVQIADNGTTQFWQDGKIEEAQDCFLITQTREELVPEIVHSVKRLIKFGKPCIVAMPITAGSSDFLAWVRDETRPPKDEEI